MKEFSTLQIVFLVLAGILGLITFWNEYRLIAVSQLSAWLRRCRQDIIDPMVSHPDVQDLEKSELLEVLAMLSSAWDGFGNLFRDSSAVSTAQFLWRAAYRQYVLLDDSLSFGSFSQKQQASVRDGFRSGYVRAEDALIPIKQMPERIAVLERKEKRCFIAIMVGLVAIGLLLGLAGIPVMF